MVVPAGQRDQRIEIQQATITKNTINEDVKGPWAQVRRPWAKAIEAQGREFLKGDQVTVQRKVAFVIPFSANITTMLRVVWLGAVFEIVSVTGTRREGELWLHCLSTGEVLP
ncbi:hypothetical protein BH10PSE12_BH10PSE12_02740 [soil metagenome]